MFALPPQLSAHARQLGSGLAALLVGLTLCNAAALAQGAAASVPAGGNGNWAWGLATVPFFVRDTIVLRVLASLTALTVLLLAIMGLAPVSLPLVFSMLLVMLINGWRIAFSLWEATRIALSEEERELFRTVFRQLSAVDFARLLKLGEWRAAAAGTVIAVEGRPLEELIVLARGQVDIERRGQPIARAGHGAFIGEISYLRGGDASATATVRAATPIRFLAWPKPRLGRLLRRNPSLNLALKTVLGLDLTQKLAKALPG